MKKTKRFLGLVLALMILIGTMLTSTAFATTPSSFKSDTNGNISIVRGETYTFKLTPTNSKSVIVFSSGNTKALQVVSNIKKGNAYYATIKAVGNVGSETGVYAAIKGQQGARLSVVKIVETSSSSGSGTVSIKSDTNNDFSIDQGAEYTVKLTAVGTKEAPQLTVGNYGVLHVISNYQKGNDHYYTIGTGTLDPDTAYLSGNPSERTSIYAELPNQKISEKLCTVTIVGDSIDPIIDNVPVARSGSAKNGLYDILEIGEYDARMITVIGILQPIVVPYDPNRTLEEHIDAIAQNAYGDINDGRFTMSGNLEPYAPRVIDDNGKMGLEILAWRKSRTYNDGAKVFNQVLSTMVYFAGHNAGESLWAWLDAWNTTSGTKVTDYGFIDSNPTGNSGTLTYKDGTIIDYNNNNGDITFLFNPKP